MTEIGIDLPETLGVNLQEPVYDTAGDIHQYDLVPIKPGEIPPHIQAILSEQAQELSAALDDNPEAEFRYMDQESREVYVMAGVQRTRFF